MEPTTAAYQISPLGDTALLIDFGNKIDENINKQVIARARQLKENLAAVIEVVPAYSSVTVYFDCSQIEETNSQKQIGLRSFKRSG